MIDEKIRMSDIHVDNIIKVKYSIGDIVVRRVHTRTASSIYESLGIYKHMSLEDCFRIIFRNSGTTFLYAKDLSSVEPDCYCAVNFDEFGYIKKVINKGNWLPEYELTWEVRDESKTYAGAKLTYNGTYGQEMLIGVSDVKIMTEEEVRQDIYGNAWKFLPQTHPDGANSSAVSAFTTDIKIYTGPIPKNGL